MEPDEQKEAERFVEQFKQIDFQVPFDSLKRQTVVVGGKKYYKDLYLVQKLIPTLTDGMVALSKELQELMNHTDEIDPQVRSRFNPCLFLGQYLMRQNHNLKPGSSPLSKLMLTYSKIENINRYFVHRFDIIHRIFVKSIGKDKKVCDISQLKLFAREIDLILGCNGDLKQSLSNNRQLLRNKEEIKFTQILDELSKYIVAKTELTETQLQKKLMQ